MPKGKGGHGAKKKKGGFGGNRDLLIKEDGEEYAQVLKILGNGRMEVHCMDEVKRIAKVRGKFKKRVWVHVNDILLVVLREFEPEKCDIIHVYYADEAKQLKQLGEIPSKIEVNENSSLQNQQIEIKFEDEEKDEKEKGKPKAEKQNINDFLPDSETESDDSENEEETKPNNPQKQVQPEAKGKGKVEAKSDSEKESIEEEDEDSEKEFDPLADI